ncbi:MAG: peptide chain release factor 1 [Planctomycetota bacterium]
MFQKLKKLADRHAELERLLQDPDVMRDSTRCSSYLKELGSLQKVVERYRAYESIEQQRQQTVALLDDPKTEPDMRELAEEEMSDLDGDRERLEDELRNLLVSEDKDTHKDAIIEIRAGTGGDEASLFAAELFRMYSRYAEEKRWKTEILSEHATEVGGFKEIVFNISGRAVFRDLRFESGGHRVQRVPETESQGRIHTSACTVAVMPEAEDIEIEIKPDELRIETYGAGGPGGQHVNKTESAVRITHIPTGIVAQCQDEKSQHKNKSKAMRVLRTRLYEALEEKARSERDAARRTLIGSGDRSQRIRTYNFPQNRVTDHRINLTLYDLENIMLGRLDELIASLQDYDRQERLKSLDLED